MNILINNTSMQPIYEQIVAQIKEAILTGTLKPEEMLPSVRSLSKELNISALTVKKAYDSLEHDNFITTIHGKGSFVAHLNPHLALEEQRKEVEQLMEQVIRKGRSCGMTTEELKNLFELILED